MNETEYQYFLQMRNGRMLNEGGWKTASDALEFFDTEVGGVVCRVVRVNPTSGVIHPQTKWLNPQTNQPLI